MNVLLTLITMTIACRCICSQSWLPVYSVSRPFGLLRISSSTCDGVRLSARRSVVTWKSIFSLLFLVSFSSALIISDFVLFVKRFTLKNSPYLHIHSYGFVSCSRVDRETSCSEARGCARPTSCSDGRGSVTLTTRKSL